MDQLQIVYKSLYDAKKAMGDLFMKSDWEDLAAEEFLRRGWRSLTNIQDEIQDLYRIRREIK